MFIILSLFFGSEKVKTLGILIRWCACFLLALSLIFIFYSSKDELVAQDAIQAPLSSLQNKEKELPLQYEQALYFYLNGNFESALITIRSIFEEYKNNLSIRLLAASIYTAQAKYDNAFAHIKIAKSLYPRRIEPIFIQIKILQEQKKSYEAIALAKRAMRFNLTIKEKVGLDLSIVASYYKLGNYKKARTQLERIFESSPQNYYAFYLDGLIFLKQERYDLAEFRLQNAIALKPKDKRDLKLLYNNLAFALEKSGELFAKEGSTKMAKQRYQEAKKYYSYANKLAPNNKIIRANYERIERR